VAVPVIAVKDAVIVELPPATAVASPVEPIVATLVVPDVQLTVEVTFPVVPSV
jgi:hypothetical protein